MGPFQQVKKTKEVHCQMLWENNWKFSMSDFSKCPQHHHSLLGNNGLTGPSSSCRKIWGASMDRQIVIKWLWNSNVIYFIWYILVEWFIIALHSTQTLQTNEEGKDKITLILKLHLTSRPLAHKPNNIVKLGGDRDCHLCKPNKDRHQWLSRIWYGREVCSKITCHVSDTWT